MALNLEAHDISMNVLIGQTPIKIAIMIFNVIQCRQDRNVDENANFMQFTDYSVGDGLPHNPFLAHTIEVLKHKRKHST